MKDAFFPFPITPKNETKTYQFHGICNGVSKGFKTGLRDEFNHLVHFGDFQAVF